MDFALYIKISETGSAKSKWTLLLGFLSRPNAPKGVISIGMTHLKTVIEVTF